MALFQQSVITKHVQSLDKKLLDQKWNDFTSIFHNIEKQTNIRNSKEEQYQEGFLRDLFVQIFGYTINPETNFNLLTEQKNQTNSKKADGAIIIIDSKIKAVIELKGTDTTDLGKIEIQAFGYKNNQPECVYVITSNFEKIRFYIENAVDFIEFNLFTLTRADFDLLYCCLSFENIKTNIPKHLKDESVSKESQITKQLYKDYSEFKRALYNNLVEKNPTIDKLLIFKKTQKLLDRFLFIFFAEDRQLVPTNLIRRINLEWEKLREMRAPFSLYDRYKMYFDDLNKGAKVTLPAFGKKTGDAITAEFEIFAYNGGLFLPDEVLDNVQIDDDILHKHSIILSDYDFDSDVDVNILGHIFENSLNEIDEIKSEIEGNIVDKTKTKRKKDGVFYTPKYITKYIVDNTVGKLCEEKKNEFGIIDEEFSKGRKNRNKTTIQKLDKSLHDYRDWLLQITICDPACGSGAFLNQALEFLIKEHKYIDELESQLLGTSIGFPGAELHILENNIYGVDLNDESVEIAKLSLWLRTAQKGRKLNSLNNNIKCGNSLIDDITIAGDKAFSWEKEFPDVFEKGGFDAVIGNPPYVRVQGLKEHYFELTKFYEQKYNSAKGNYDIYVLFIEKSYELINSKGEISYILPHKFLISEFGDSIRGFLKENNKVFSILHFEEHLVFEVTTYTCILNINKRQKNELLFKNINPSKILENFSWEKESYENLNNDKWHLNNNSTANIFKKINKQKNKLENFLNVFSGIQTSGDNIYIIEGEEKNGFVHGFSKETQNNVIIEREILKPIIKGNNIKRYGNVEKYGFVIFPYEFIDNKPVIITEPVLKQKFPNCYAYLLENEIKLRARENGKMNKEGWYSFVYPKNLFLSNQIKLVSPDITFGLNVTKDTNPLCLKNGAYGIELKNVDVKFENYLLCILNSNLLWFYLKSTGNVLRGGYFRFNTQFINPFPIPDFPKNLSKFDDSSNKMLSLNVSFNTVCHKFSSYFSNQYKIEKLSGKLEKWYELDFTDFIRELNKSVKTFGGTTLTKKDEFEWMDLFEENKKKALELKSEIDKTNKEIDIMIYELYGLSEEEIKIVEA